MRRTWGDAKEQKERLKARDFTKIKPERLAKQVLGTNDFQMVWDTKYEGKYVRWKGKFERKGMAVVKFIATTGEISSMSCANRNAR